MPKSTAAKNNMIKISRLADYSVMIMRFLSLHAEEKLSAASISTETHINLPTVSKVLKLLSDAKLLTATRGAMGGYALERTADQITVADIISAIDGKPAITVCSTESTSCEHDHHCGLRDNWQFINRIIFDVLNTVTLQDMCQPLHEECSLPITFHGLTPALQEKLQTQINLTLTGSA